MYHCALQQFDSTTPPNVGLESYILVFILHFLTPQCGVKKLHFGFYFTLFNPTMWGYKVTFLLLSYTF